MGSTAPLWGSCRPPPPPYFAVLALLALAAFSTRLVTGVQAFAARHYVWLLPQSLYVGVLCMSLIGSPGQGIAFRQIFFLSSFIMVAAAFAATSSNARTMRHLGAVALISFVAVTELLAHRVGQSWTMAIPRFLTTGDLDYNIYDFFRATFNAIDDPGNVQVSAGEKNALSVAVLTAGVMFRMGAPEGRAARAAPGCQNRYSPSRLPSLKTAI